MTPQISGKSKFLGDIGNAPDFGDNINLVLNMFKIFMRLQNGDINKAVRYSSLESRREIWSGDINSELPAYLCYLKIQGEKKSSEKVKYEKRAHKGDKEGASHKEIEKK